MKVSGLLVIILVIISLKEFKADEALPESTIIVDPTGSDTDRPMGRPCLADVNCVTCATVRCREGICRMVGVPKKNPGDCDCQPKCIGRTRRFPSGTAGALEESGAGGAAPESMAIKPGPTGIAGPSGGPIDRPCVEQAQCLSCASFDCIPGFTCIMERVPKQKPGDCDCRPRCVEQSTPPPPCRTTTEKPKPCH